MDIEQTADIFIECPLWEEKIPNCKELIQSALEIVRQHFKNLPTEASLSVVLADNAFIATLNLQYRGKKKPTNVLSFPAYDPNDPMPTEILGDIVLAYETIVAEAKEQNKVVDHHVQHLIIHGFLHLIGYDHEAEKEATVMEALEIQLLEKLGIANPYNENYSISAEA